MAGHDNLLGCMFDVEIVRTIKFGLFGRIIPNTIRHPPNTRTRQMASGMQCLAGKGEGAEEEEDEEDEQEEKKHKEERSDEAKPEEMKSGHTDKQAVESGSSHTSGRALRFGYDVRRAIRAHAAL